MKVFILTIFLGLAPSAVAFAPQVSDRTSPSVLFGQLDRRDILKSVGAGTMCLTGLVLQTPSVSAAGSPPTEEDMARIRKGYKQIQYLLDNFEQETTVCRENGGECKRDAEPIRKGVYDVSCV